MNTRFPCKAITFTLVGDWLEGSDEEFLVRAWRLVLRSDPDDEGRAQGVDRLQQGRISRAGYLAELLGDEPFARVRALDDGVAYARLNRGRPRELRAPGSVDERAIEIPWTLARYDGERRVLDVGTAFAEPAYVGGLLDLDAPDLVTVDLAEGASVIADVRDLPFEDGRFDLIFCVSTLEHIGRDNTTYAVDAPSDAEGDAAALRELRRVLARDGRLLVTVPTGERDDQGWQLQREPQDWIDVFKRAGFTVFEDELYVRTPEDGWRAATLAEAATARYEADGAGAVLLAELRPGTVGEKLRLAVRDVRHRDVVRRSTRVP
jgi:O-antigen chain-terminating methyltransferase